MLEVWCIMVMVAMSCSMIGSLLVLRNQSMLADAMSHSVLLGIVLGFFISNSLESPLLVLGATFFGVLAVLAIDLLHSQKVNHDAATGLVFSFFFALAVILISLFARNVHLDVDMVLMGEVLFAPLHRMDIFGISLSVSMIKTGVTLLLNSFFFAFFYRPLSLFLLDKTQARLTGLPVKKLQFLILLLVALTTVLSFDAIGSMTVIVFLVAPAMTALSWVGSFQQLLLGGLAVALVNASTGFFIGYQLDLTMSGSCAVVSLVVFCSSVVLQKLRTSCG
ncbi:metal ABC transporter permease [Streptococcus sp. X16XC17]|uniref:metal ABC transporter permease n=1 Tax=unclassified Streptococcus TaxID=2608887 RepID=UPI00066FE461|nr:MULTISPECIES: metal ABC transporter permease [unclassified Streptococcus]TCD45844.1 metal ABC transporter permease [Streptococcus sp. X16XC17]